MKPLHEELKTIRIEKDISLKEISDKMRIRLDYLERIEEGDYTVTPLPFLRLFLREYAEVVGIDPDLAMLKFDKKIDSIISSDTIEKPPGDESTRHKRTETGVKILKPEESSEENKSPETSEDEKTVPKKRKRRKKTSGEKKSSPKKPRKTETGKETPVESEPEKADTPEEEIQTSLFNGDTAPAEKPIPETNKDLPPEEESLPEEFSPPAEKVQFKQVKIIGEEQRREVSKSINSLLSDEQKSSNIQFYGVIVIMTATIALIIYLVASGIIF